MNNSPAFPCDLTMYDEEVKVKYQGVSMRDYFAAKAMQGFATNLGPGATFETRANIAYQWADAMLRARGEQA